MPNALTPLANLTLGSAQNSVTFSSINQSYGDLLLVVSNVRQSTTNFQMMVRVNGNASSSYLWSAMAGSGSSTSATQASTATTQWSLSGSVIPSTTSAQMVLHFIDYAATNKSKTMLSRLDVPTASSPGTSSSFGLWTNTAAISSVTLFIQGGTATFSTGTNFALYGVSK